MSSRLQELTAKREEEKKEAQNLALKYNEVVIQPSNQMDQAKFLQSENEKLAKVLLCTISLSCALAIFCFGLLYFEIADVFS